MSATTFLLALAGASIAAVALGLLVQQWIRDAATRHAVLLASLMLPPVLALAAMAELGLPATSAPAPAVVEMTAGAPLEPIPGDRRLPLFLGALWLAGTLIALARIVAIAMRWRGVADRAEIVSDAAILARYDGSSLLTRSAEVGEPTVIGIVDPIVVLPAAYDLEPAELDAVFAHELAHIARRDNLTALAVQLVCAPFWFDPLHRIARRKLVELRERVCDDLVLERGCDPNAYLTALARSCETSLHNPAVACMSRLNLQERMESIMTHDTRRRWPIAIVRAFVTTAVAVAAIAFATFVPAPMFAGDITADEYDFDVRATPHPDGRYTLNVRIDTPDGPFSSVAVVKSAPDTRTVSTTLGDTTYQVIVKLAADGSALGTFMVSRAGTIVLSRGKPFERQAMQGGAFPAAKPDTAGLTPPRPIHQVEPLYPNDAKQARIAGVVIIKTSIDETGNVTATQILKDLPYGLGQAAADAIRQWKFQPATRDGRPVATDFNLTINFRPD